MSRFHVGGKVVDTVDLLRKRHWAWCLDLWPFAVLYGVWLLAVVPSLDFSDASIVLGSIGAFHVLVFLFTVWSVDFKCFMQYSKVNNIQRADACKITPAKFFGSKEVVPLHFRKLAASSTSLGTEEIYFDFRKQRFICSDEQNMFFKLPYPSKETIGYYLKNTGYGTEAKIQATTEKWGRNVFEYPQATFQSLLKEQIMEPFFVFQVFCVGLWCLDEYWYYSLFTLFMLFMFESTMAKSRLKTLSELRRVKVDSQILMVYRCGKWLKISGTELLPADVVSIGRSTGLDGEDKSVPADMLILAGSAIVNEAILTGESTPQWKVSVIGRGTDEKLATKRDKAHVLFGGTKILQHSLDKTFHLKDPDGGYLAVVLRTGFETSQGKLMRTILFSTERVTANSWESGLFILFLVVFALIAVGYVLKKGLEDPTRSKYKLLLSCSLIITSVIPPELPMELSIAVNTSLIALACRGIYCTEPFRLPFAGNVDICCFDKTGTLTSNDMEFSEVGGLTHNEDLDTEMSKVPDRTLEILASCHALVFVDNKLVGDPLEKTALKGVEWSYKSDEKAMPKKWVAWDVIGCIKLAGGGGLSAGMAATLFWIDETDELANVTGGSWAVVEDEATVGVRALINTRASAIIARISARVHQKPFRRGQLVDVPAWYVKTYKKYTRQGSRVLALAYKSLPEMTVSDARSLERDTVESGLTFAGFAVFNCPIRGDSAAVLSELKGSSHDLVMITGDQALTACHVAGQVNIISKPALILGRGKSKESYEWVTPDENYTVPYSEDEVEALSEAHDLCIGGDCIEMLQQNSSTLKVIPYVKLSPYGLCIRQLHVFAQVAPEQKELIITTFKSVGRVTLMCGDGTNDVGALKQSLYMLYLTQYLHLKITSLPLKHHHPKTKPTPISANIDTPSKSRAVTKPESTTNQALNRHLTAATPETKKLNEDGADGRSAPIVKLGDASM
ncbi:hypothetical protein BUALT_Bualt01G0128600 [Buddleja alternifolia]|uniref:Cation-transporting ATPase 13A1 n=1 Tax=Buddleja alternifolia TaxID=168488 RepID=A0AAV6YHG8_9LAMI|nr:hypothetical protein BUALT_Bualt01G0128600 [Buddleja alternifolia]